jgi:DNA-binding transcriptional regulator of glucitol operon
VYRLRHTPPAAVETTPVRVAVPRRASTGPTGPMSPVRRADRAAGGYRHGMLRLARTPRWIGGLLFAMLAAAVCAGLGKWQWDRSQGVHGDLQNLAYAFNWWLFSILCLWFWWKALRDDVARLADPEAPAVGAAGLAPSTPRPTAAARTAGSADAELDEWNAWLAELGSRPRR